MSAIFPNLERANVALWYYIPCESIRWEWKPKRTTFNINQFKVVNIY